MSVVVLLGSALLCLDQTCYPALVGRDTPTGHFALHRRYVTSPGYGGDVMQFLETETEVFAIHRVWTGAPKEKRMWRLIHGNVRARQSITQGCINVAPDVYDKLTSQTMVTIQR